MPIVDKLRKMIRNKGGSVARVNTIEAAVKELGRLDDNPLSGLIVDASIAADTDLLGKYVADLQSDVAVANGKVTGTLNWITDYASFGSAEEQTGNFLALYARVPGVTGVTLTVKADYGRETELDPDGLFIRRIQNGDSAEKWFEITAEKDGYATIKRRYSLMGLTLEEEGD